MRLYSAEAGYAYSWRETYGYALRLFNELPTDRQVALVLGAFRQAPALVLAEIRRVGSDVQAGRIRSGWAILAYKLSAPLDVADELVTNGDEEDHFRRIGRRWIENAGLHFDRESEVEEVLFGRYGIMPEAPGDVRVDLIAYWHRLLPDL